ncbi:MAG: hypothetical protein GX913_09230 [Clostridiales bacterium]|nr:hypothetical protein [Clostridiales bacterium]
MQKENMIKYGVIVFVSICAGILYFLSILDTDKKDSALYLVNETMKSSTVPLVTEFVLESEEVIIETSTTIDKIYIHVCGEVVDPGVYEIEEGSRVWDAINVAGGITKDAASDYINLAQIVTDGEKVVVPSVNEVDGFLESETAKSQKPGTGNSLININTASLEELMTLSGIGKSKAESIISYRETNGPFVKIDDIMNISGIKEAAFEKMKKDIDIK